MLFFMLTNLISLIQLLSSLQYPSRQKLIWPVIRSIIFLETHDIRLGQIPDIRPNYGFLHKILSVFPRYFLQFENVRKNCSFHDQQLFVGYRYPASRITGKGN